MWQRLRRALLQLIGCCMRSKPHKAKPSFTRTSLSLHRMARSRRLATSVTRILATKPEVVAGIRKRLLASDGLVPSDHAEVAIYFGDIQGEIKKNRSVYCMN
jgi:magnesium transporter